MNPMRRVLGTVPVLGLLAVMSCAQRSATSATPPAQPATANEPRPTRVRAPARPAPPPKSMTTIAPFPVPGDTSPNAALGRKMLNVPKPGDFVYVTELPEAIEKVPPEYPPDARASGVQGTVTIQALVHADGTVGETLVAQSVPGLDLAAAACVLQWRFKPARNENGPTAVWVMVPIKFTLH